METFKKDDASDDGAEQVKKKQKKKTRWKRGWKLVWKMVRQNIQHTSKKQASVQYKKKTKWNDFGWRWTKASQSAIKPHKRGNLSVLARLWRFWTLLLSLLLLPPFTYQPTTFSIQYFDDEHCFWLIFRHTFCALIANGNFFFLYFLCIKKFSFEC